MSYEYDREREREIERRRRRRRKPPRRVRYDRIIGVAAIFIVILILFVSCVNSCGSDDTSSDTDSAIVPTSDKDKDSEKTKTTNADGEKEYISMLDSASGYLALDKNEDGVINDGNELFGTQSGNGFYDLLQYDTDGNGWIDEADEIFQKLKIWQMTEDGTSSLIDLKEAGVGAIYLGYEDTKFSLNNAQNKTNAIIQKTGLFLYENGYTGTIQQMDLAV